MDPKELAAQQRKFLTDCQTIFAGISVDGLPEQLGKMLGELKASIDSALAKMGLTDSVPAALDAGYVLRMMAERFREVSEMAGAATKSLNGATKELVEARAGLKAFEDRIKSGELVEKPTVEKAVSEYATRMAGRRTEMAACGLPLPVDDTLLAGDDDGWKKRMGEAKERHERLAKAGVKGDTARVQRLCFGDPDAFELVMANIKPEPEPMHTPAPAAAAKGGGAVTFRGV